MEPQVLYAHERDESIIAVVVSMKGQLADGTHVVIDPDRPHRYEEYRDDSDVSRDDDRHVVCVIVCLAIALVVSLWRIKAPTRPKTVQNLIA